MNIALRVAAVIRMLLALAMGVLAAGTYAADADYVLGPGDVIKITVFQSPDLTLDTRVSESNTITFPLIGSVTIGGLSIQAAEQKLAGQLKEGGFLTQPQVNILLMQIRSAQVAMLGQVNRPGRYPLETTNNRISDVLALAGGPSLAGADTVTLVGTRDGKRVRIEVDIPSLFQSAASEQDIIVQGGDILYVHRAPMFYIYGEVQRPGGFRLERDMTVMQALAQGGGITLRGTQRRIKLHRKGKDGKVEELRPEMSDVLQPDDVIYVRESLF